MRPPTRLLFDRPQHKLTLCRLVCFFTRTLKERMAQFPLRRLVFCAGAACAALAWTMACAADPFVDGHSVPWARWIASGIVGDTTPGGASSIGTVAATAITSRGEVLVLDGADMRVLGFDRSGAMLARASGPGDGPGEMRDPVALAVIAADSVVIVDRTLRRISVLSPLASGVRGVRDVRIDFAPGAACAIESTLYVLGTRGHEYLHRFDEARLLAASYSPVEPDAAVEQQDMVASLHRFELGSGYLACVPERGLLIHAPESRGTLYGISLSGELAWSHAIDSFVPPLRVARSGGVRLDLDPRFGYSERIVSLTTLSRDIAQLVVRRGFARDAGRAPEYWSVLIDLRSGANVSRQADAPRFSAVGQSYATEPLEEPVPHVRVWRR